MKLPTVSSNPADLLQDAGMAISDFFTPTLRLGVTGLSRSGKTVFITGLVHCLTQGSAAPEFKRVTGIEGFRAYLEPQPNDDVPRFQFEEHLAALGEDPPRWPESTRRVSQLRLTLEWTSQDAVWNLFGAPQRLHVDIIDYPGEWLIDLAMLDQSFARWSDDALALARSERAGNVSGPFLKFLKDEVGQTSAEQDDEQVAIRGARLFTDYLLEARRTAPTLATLGPGRFLLPGDLEGSPQLTFFPVSSHRGEGDPEIPGSLRALLERRFESYKSNIVKPFFEQHFSRLDRQIVLIDALGAINGGGDAMADLEHGLDGVLRAFRPGGKSWLSLLMPRRIDRIVFAASKADHVHRTSYKRLEAILDKAVSRASKRAQAQGAAFQTVALAALKATEDVDRKAGDDTYHCIRGVPEPGEVVDGRTFDGKKQAVVFPGDLPSDPLVAFEPERTTSEDYSFVRFAPPPQDQASTTAEWPHVGLDTAFTFLFGDDLP